MVDCEVVDCEVVVWYEEEMGFGGDEVVFYRRWGLKLGGKRYKERCAVNSLTRFRDVESSS